jgi:8-oxo-dGTP diphosphatase
MLMPCRADLSKWVKPSKTLAGEKLKEETNLELQDLQLIGVYSAPNRDTRGHVIAVAFVARADLSQLSAGDDAAQTEVVGNWRDRLLAFDHRQIIEDAQNVLRKQAAA